VPQSITLFRVFFAAPSDVSEELQIAREILNEWNLQHGQQSLARVELVNWRTHARPAAGKRPQASINKEAFDVCDVVIAIFWSRFGMGTEEEINRAIKQGKPVLVYFSIRPLPTQKLIEHSRIEKFKRQFGQKALYWVYSDIDSFEKELRNHVALTMHDLLKRKSLRVE